MKSSTRSRLILIRHAHTEMAGKFCGQIDPPLSTAGLAQLPELNETLHGYSFSHIFSSDLARTRQTAGAIARGLNLPVRLLRSLREIGFGRWEGLDWDQVVAQDPACAQRWLDHYPSIPAPGGEGLEHFRKRIREAMDSIADQVRGGCAVVVTHGGVIRTFSGNLARRGNPGEFRCDYAGCWEISREQQQWSTLQEISASAAYEVTGISAMRD
jgi:broad specificity phosphatase PhoE